MLPLLAQTAAEPHLDPISGGAGWVGAGLLGAVLAWLLLWYLPKKDTQFEKLWADKDAYTKSLVDAFTASLKAQADKYEVVEQRNNDAHKAEVANVLTHCQRESAVLASALSKEFELLRKELKTNG